MSWSCVSELWWQKARPLWTESCASFISLENKWGGLIRGFPRVEQCEEWARDTQRTLASALTCLEGCLRSVKISTCSRITQSNSPFQNGVLFFPSSSLRTLPHPFKVMLALQSKGSRARQLCLSVFSQFLTRCASDILCHTHELTHLSHFSCSFSAQQKGFQSLIWKNGLFIKCLELGLCSKTFHFQNTPPAVRCELLLVGGKALLACPLPRRLLLWPRYHYNLIIHILMSRLLGGSSKLHISSRLSGESRVGCSHACTQSHPSLTDMPDKEQRQKRHET